MRMQNDFAFVPALNGLWGVEDALRDCENVHGPAFIIVMFHNFNLKEWGDPRANMSLQELEVLLKRLKREQGIELPYDFKSHNGRSRAVYNESLQGLLRVSPSVAAQSPSAYKTPFAAHFRVPAFQYLLETLRGIVASRRTRARLARSGGDMALPVNFQEIGFANSSKLAT